MNKPESNSPKRSHASPACCHSRHEIVLACFMSILLSPAPAVPGAQGRTYILDEKEKGAFALSASGLSAPLVASSMDYPGVVRILKHLQADIAGVTGARPAVVLDTLPDVKEVVLAGTLGKNPMIDALVRNRKIDASAVSGRLETFLIQAVDDPVPGVDRALVIAGSDKRGTLYGIYDLSANIGVSPWVWWADVPARKRACLYVRSGRYSSGEPAVRYRGLFINDEAPALSGWVFGKFGGFNSAFYEKVFELILRLRGNFLWPAMWGRAFYDDDPENARLADEYGVVIGTSHHEPMMRAHDEWRRYGSGPWNYDKNEKALQEFWRQGIERMKSNESVVTVGMRGDGDEPMSEQANISLLERIVRDQRRILGDGTGKNPEGIPQAWALYKEVQEYYDRGMRVPDDVTLLLCDDNWGNIRKLPDPGDKPRGGGYGIYYHYDYVGGPRNYKWLNTNQISRVWEQMHLAFEHGADRLWIVNVGDIKPMEFPISFFLDYAWNPDAWPAERLDEYARLWAEQQFGRNASKAAAEMLTRYTQFNSRRKPELLSPGTYSLVNSREAESVVLEYNRLAEQARLLHDSLQPEARDAFYQLVLHPVAASANLNELHVTIGKNRLYAEQGRAGTNALAERAADLFQTDSLITFRYNHVMSGGKWNHMMDQTHIGYTYWQQPDANKMPEVRKIDLPENADPGMAVEGSTRWWPMEKGEAVLPEFDSLNRQSFYIELFNRGKNPFEYTVDAGEAWMQVAPRAGIIETETRLRVDVDWAKVPAGDRRVPITITTSAPAGAGARFSVLAPVRNDAHFKKPKKGSFVERNGFVSIEAEHASRTICGASAGWLRIPGLGRTLSGMTPFPVTAPARSPEEKSPRLEYNAFFRSKGKVRVRAFLSPTLDYSDKGGLRYGISFDGGPVQIVNMHANRTFQDWEESVRNNVTICLSEHALEAPGEHVLKYWMVDPGVVLQKLVVETGPGDPTYLGPPESLRWNMNPKKGR